MRKVIDAFRASQYNSAPLIITFNAVGVSVAISLNLQGYLVVSAGIVSGLFGTFLGRLYDALAELKSEEIMTKRHKK